MKFAARVAPLVLLLAASLPAFALRGVMEKATVHAMRRVPCPDSGMRGWRDGGDCMEYELRSEKVSYVIRPNRPLLLLLGGEVYIKLAQSELLLRANEEAKEVRCQVLAMALTTDIERREQAAAAAHAEGARTRIVSRCYTESGREIPCPDEP